MCSLQNVSQSGSHIRITRKALKRIPVHGPRPTGTHISGDKTYYLIFLKLPLVLIYTEGGELMI